MFSNKFLFALSNWQKGWSEDRDKKEQITNALVEELKDIPDEFKQVPNRVYRKRHIYKKDVLPLIWGQLLDDGICSWSEDFHFADKFKDNWRYDDLDYVCGAIFKKKPKSEDVILNIPSLWRNKKFKKRIIEFQSDFPNEARALLNFTGSNNQKEIIMKSPLYPSEIISLTGLVKDLDNTLIESGFSKTESLDFAYKILTDLDFYEGKQSKVRRQDATRVIQNVIKKWQEKLNKLYC